MGDDGTGSSTKAPTVYKGSRDGTLKRGKKDEEKKSC